MFQKRSTFLAFPKILVLTYTAKKHILGIDTTKLNSISTPRSDATSVARVDKNICMF